MINEIDTDCWWFPSQENCEAGSGGFGPDDPNKPPSGGDSDGDSDGGSDGGGKDPTDEYDEPIDPFTGIVDERVDYFPKLILAKESYETEALVPYGDFGYLIISLMMFASTSTFQTIFRKTYSVTIDNVI